MNNKVLFVAFQGGFANYCVVDANQVKVVRTIAELVKDSIAIYEYPLQADRIYELLDDGYALEDQCVEIKKLMAEITNEQ